MQRRLIRSDLGRYVNGIGTRDGGIQENDWPGRVVNKAAHRGRTASIYRSQSREIDARRVVSDK